MLQSLSGSPYQSILISISVSCSIFYQIGIRSLVFSTVSAIWESSLRHPRGLQISGMYLSLVLRFQETSRVFPQRALDVLLFESCVLTLYFN